MNNVARDEFGVLSSKNTVSKYWGVSKVKGKEQFTVRFHDKVNKEVITFKPKGHELPEVVAAQIAARFFDEDDLYSSSTIIGMIFKQGTAEVNTCTNTIDFVADEVVETVKLPLTELADSIVDMFTKEVSKPKKEKSTDGFRNLVDSIIAGALTRAKTKLALEAQALYA